MYILDLANKIIRVHKNSKGKIKEFTYIRVGEVGLDVKVEKSKCHITLQKKFGAFNLKSWAGDARRMWKLLWSSYSSRSFQS